MDEPRDLSFLAPPETLADWRMVLAYEAAARAGVLGALPGTPDELAARCDVDDGALRAGLGQLAAWEIVEIDEEGRYRAGPGAPTSPHGDILLNHAATIRRWAALLGPRLHDRTAGRRLSRALPRRPARSGPRRRPRRALAGVHPARLARDVSGPARGD